MFWGKKSRFGIVGAGVIGSLQAGCIVSLKEAELVAIADTSEKRARKLAEKYGLTHYTDYNEMLRRRDIDIVSVCVPSGYHCKIAVAAAEAGKNEQCCKTTSLSRIPTQKLTRLKLVSN